MRAPLRILAALLLTAACSPAADLPSRAPDYVAEARSLASLLDEGVRHAEAGDPVRARLSIGEAFFRFEESALHREIRGLDPALYGRLEEEWLHARALAASGESGSRVGAQVRVVTGLLGESLARVVPEAGRAGSRRKAFLDSFVILLREGIEAILILSLILATVAQAGAPRHRLAILGGAGAALLATGLLAILAALWSPPPALSEAVEGITMLLAVIVLFGVSHWIVSRVQSRRWADFIRERVREAAGAGHASALGALAFLVVFREGFETVLFYKALWFSSGGAAGSASPILAGIAAALLALLALCAAVLRAGRRIPVRGFFAVTSALLYFLAFKFAGDGLHELQEASWLPMTLVPGFPDAAFLRDWLGIRGTVETLAGQALLLAAAAGSLLVVAIRERRPAREAAAEASR